MVQWTSAYLSIGSNKGNKIENLARALNCLRKEEKIDVEDQGLSGLYRTEPQNFTDQDWFVNGALKIRTLLEPEGLLDRLKAVEHKLDKAGKPFRFGPRIIDLDIIYYGERVMRTERLELPHPRMHERCFVLRPLCDIAVNKVHPVLNKTTGELLKQIETDESQAVIPLAREEIREIFY